VAFAGLLMAYFRQSKRRTTLFLETLLNHPKTFLCLTSAREQVLTDSHIDFPLSPSPLMKGLFRG
jgi:hypothetical protein